MFLISASEGVEREREMVNLERSWSRVIIKRSERGGYIVDAPLRSHTLPDTATQMWLFVNDCPTTGFNRVTAHYQLQKTL